MLERDSLLSDSTDPSLPTLPTSTTPQKKTFYDTRLAEPIVARPPTCSSSLTTISLPSPSIFSCTTLTDLVRNSVYVFYVQKHFSVVSWGLLSLRLDATYSRSLHASFTSIHTILSYFPFPLSRILSFYHSRLFLGSAGRARRMHSGTHDSSFQRSLSSGGHSSSSLSFISEDSFITKSGNGTLGA